MDGTQTLAEAQAALSSFDDTVGKLEEGLRPLLEAVAAAREDESVPALSRARAHATLAYALNAMYYAYLRANTAEPSEYPITGHLERVQKLFARLRQVERLSGEGQERTDLHGLRMATERMDEFLIPEEEALLHASKGNVKPRMQHKRFDDNGDEKVEAEAKEEPEYDGDVEMTPANDKVRKKKKKKAAKEEKVADEEMKEEPQDDGEADEKTPKKSSKKKKKKAAEAEATPGEKKSSRKKRRESEGNVDTPRRKKKGKKAAAATQQ